MTHEPAPIEQRGFLRRLDQLSVGVVIGLSLAIIGGYWWKKVGSPRGAIEADRDVQFQVDLNTADWPELMVLPDIGETRARQIVEWRDEHGPFSTHEDMLAIPGVGTKTLEKIRPYLRPILASRGEIGS